MYTLHSHKWVCKWYLRFSDGEATKTKVVDLKKLCNFVVDNFSIWNHLSNRNYIWFLKFKIWIFQITSDEENTQNKSCRSQKVVQLCSWQFFHLKSFIYPRKITVEFSHIWNSNSSNDLEWRNDQNQNYRSRKVIKLCSW